MDMDLGHVGRDVFDWSHFQVNKGRLAGVLGESKRKREGNKGQGMEDSCFHRQAWDPGQLRRLCLGDPNFPCRAAPVLLEELAAFPLHSNFSLPTNHPTVQAPHVSSCAFSLP